MEPIKIKNPEEFRKELEKLNFLEIKDVGNEYTIKYVCDDWFARFLKSNLIGGFNSEDNELILLDKMNLHYINFKQLFKFLEVIKNG